MLERAGAQVWRRDIVGIADFARASTLPRFHFVNMENGTIRSFHVTHGRGSDPAHSGFLQQFSSVPGSEATSRGAYLTAEWYKGKYGTSIRLEGLDHDNSNALDRAIVMHPATYASPTWISKQGKLGRSEGHFTVALLALVGCIAALQFIHHGKAQRHVVALHQRARIDRRQLEQHDRQGQALVVETGHGKPAQVAPSTPAPSSAKTSTPRPMRYHTKGM